MQSIQQTVTVTAGGGQGGNTSPETIRGLMLVVDNPDPKQYMVKYLWVLVSVNIFGTDCSFQTMRIIGIIPKLKKPILNINT